MNDSRAACRWEDVQLEMAAILRIPPEVIRPDCRLIADLGADSVALAEIVAYVVVDCGVKDLSLDLDLIDWEEITVEHLYAACEAGTGEGITTVRRPR